MSPIQTEDRQGVLLVRFSDRRLDDEVQIKQVGSELLACLNQGPGALVLDFGNIEFFSSAMLGQLALLSKRCQGEGTELAFCNIAPGMREVLRVVRFGQLAKMYDDLDAALAPFSDHGTAIELPDHGTVYETNVLRRHLEHAQNGNAVSQFQLAVCYEDGKGVEQDFGEAMHWYRAAAEQGHADAEHALGVHYAYGMCVSQDFREAMNWFERAADQGHPEAQYMLAMAYSHGLDVPQNHETAAHWFRRAAESGNVEAQSSLADAYLAGSGVEQDTQAAIRWYQAAAEQGHADAQARLAWFYAEGEGVPASREEALKWYRRAAEQGHPQARRALEEL